MTNGKIVAGFVNDQQFYKDALVMPNNVVARRSVARMLTPSVSAAMHATWRSKGKMFLGRSLWLARDTTATLEIPASKCYV